jgi:hypothetical protein
VTDGNSSLDWELPVVKVPHTYTCSLRIINTSYRTVRGNTNPYPSNAALEGGQGSDCSQPGVLRYSRRADSSGNYRPRSYNRTSYHHTAKLYRHKRIGGQNNKPMLHPTGMYTSHVLYEWHLTSNRLHRQFLRWTAVSTGRALRCAGQVQRIADLADL